jgi:hypothetical protein
MTCHVFSLWLVLINKPPDLLEMPAGVFTLLGIRVIFRDKKMNFATGNRPSLQIQGGELIPLQLANLIHHR